MSHKQIKEFEAYVIDIRRRLHQIPELAWEEEKTLALILKEIRSSMEDSLFDCTIAIKKGGVWVDLTVDPDYERILFRADIDGLPIQEETDLPYASLHDGRMHACGHDAHTAMLLGAFKAITQGVITPTHNIRFVWQRAEENAWDGSGGEYLVADGVCDDIAAVYAIHVGATLDPGVFYSRPGIALANAAHLLIEVKCDGGHTMHPHFGSNAIDIITDIHVALRGLPLRVLGPEETVSFVPTISLTGTAPNVMPNHAKLFYSIRNFLPREKRDALLLAVHEKITSIVSGYSDGTLDVFTFYPGFPPLTNDPDNYHTTNTLLQARGFTTDVGTIIFAGEDFSYYLEKCPGSFWVLGVRQGDTSPDHHTPLFNLDEKQLWKGVAFWLELATSRETAPALVAADRG